MNILQINSNYINSALHRAMIEHLNSDDIHTTIFCPTWDQRKAENFSVNKNEIISVCFKKWDRIFFFLKQRKIRKALCGECGDIGRFDLIHALTLFTDGNTAYELHKKYGLPYFVAVRNTDLNVFFRLKPWLRPRGGAIMRNARGIFFLSKTYRDLVLSIMPKNHKGSIEEKSYIVPNGIDDFWLKRKFFDRNIELTNKHILNKQINVICVGTIDRNKNISTVQRALHLMRQGGWNISFKVIGKIVDPSEYSRIISDNLTIYNPPVDKTELILHYREGDIFVLASHTETFGLVYAEAMSQGLPVIYTKGQGFDGQFPEGEVGYSVNDRNPFEIAEAIKKVCMDYSRFSKNALDLVDKFDWNKICTTYRALFSEAL